MPYSDKTMTIDKVKLGRNRDARYALPPEKEAELLADIKTGMFTNSHLARAYGCSISKVWNLANPEKYEENKRKRAKMDDSKYRVKEKIAEIKRKNRAKKREILKK